MLRVHKWPMSADMVEPVARMVAETAGLDVLHTGYIAHSISWFMSRRYPGGFLRYLDSASRFVRRALEVFDQGNLCASAAMCEGAIQVFH
jgi:hypothetical protein